MKATRLASSRLFSTKEKRPDDPLKSRVQNSWPGQSGKAG